MLDKNAQALAAVRRSARAAEKRLNATEAEKRFASDIAAGIYTAGMIPAVMDADKIMELADCYIAEKAFEANSVQPEISNDPKQEDMSSEPSGISTSSHHQKSISLYFFLRRIQSWIPIICILIFFVILCVYTYNPGIFSSGAPDKTGDVDSLPHSVDYETQYVGSINSSFVHRNTCRHAENILKKNRIYYSTLEDAIEDGRSKCSECLGGASIGTAPQTSDNSAADDFASRYLELRDRRREGSTP